MDYLRAKRSEGSSKTPSNITQNDEMKKEGVSDSKTWSNLSTDSYKRDIPYEKMKFSKSYTAKTNGNQGHQVEPNLQKTLTEFTAAYLVENPKDMIDYAVKYFTKLQDFRRRNTLEIARQLQELERYRTDAANTRRKPVCCEVYDPEEDNLPSVVVPKTTLQAARIKTALKEVQIFRYLSETQLQKVVDAMCEKRVRSGEVIIRQNDEGDYFYVVENGSFDIVKNGERVFSWNNKGAFGEIALMYQIKRTATVLATTDGVLWAMNRESFRRILLKHAYTKQKMYLKFLESVPMLQELTHFERLNLAEVLVPMTFLKGDIIVKEGDQANGMYFIEKGNVTVYVKGENTNARIINNLGQTQYFGELALLLKDTRRATVVADTDVKLAFLDKCAFERMLGKCTNVLNRAIADYKFKDNRMDSYLKTMALEGKT